MILIRINCPDPAIAEAIATAAVDARLAACANIHGPIRSVYRWNGQIEQGEETVVLLKTRAALFEQIEALVTQHHPDETPAIIAIPVSHSATAFDAWLITETS